VVSHHILTAALQVLNRQAKRGQDIFLGLNRNSMALAMWAICKNQRQMNFVSSATNASDDPSHTVQYDAPPFTTEALDAASEGKTGIDATRTTDNFATVALLHWIMVAKLTTTEQQM
jgi:hypothetical protein